MTIDPIPSVRSGRHARHAFRAIALAAVAAITITACSSDSSDEAAGSQEPTSSTTPPSTSPPAEATDATSQTGTVDGSIGDVPITYTVPDGWEDIGWGVTKGDPIIGMFFMEVGNTFTGPCEAIALDPPVGPTVEDLAAVWADRPELNATAPIDITVDGFGGQQVDFTVPDYPTGENADDCAGGGHYLLLEGVGTPGDGYWAQGPNQHHELRILDIDGTRVVIGAMSFPDTSAQDQADIAEMVGSIRIG